MKAVWTPGASLRVKSVLYVMTWMVVGDFVTNGGLALSRLSREDYLIGRRSFDEGNGRVVSDVSGAGIDGTVRGAEWRSKGRWTALDFDGEDDALDLGNMDIMGEELTLGFWFYADDFDVGDARFISKAEGVYDEDHYWMVSTIDGTALRFRLKADGSTGVLISNQGVIGANRWHHVAATYDGAVMRLYRDGIKVAEMSKSGTIDTDSTVGVAIGNQPMGAGSRPFDGMIDDVAILERELGAKEIAAIVQKGDRTRPSRPVGLSAESVSPIQANLTWEGTTDSESGIRYYKIYRDGEKVGESSEGFYEDRDVPTLGTHQYTVSAVNGTGLESERSEAVDVVMMSERPVPALTLEWNRSRDWRVVGYRLYHGRKPEALTESVDLEDSVRTQVSGLEGGETYHFAVTAYTATGIESQFSNEVTYTVPELPEGSSVNDDWILVERAGAATRLAGGAKSVLENDRGVGRAEANLESETSCGTLSFFGDGTFRYVHNGSGDRVDQFEYSITDEGGVTDGGKVWIWVMEALPDEEIEMHQQRLEVQKRGGHSVLVWEGEGVLQEAVSPEGLWVDLPKATSPFRLPTMDGAMRIYRLRSFRGND